MARLWTGREEGVALFVVIVVALALAGSSALFIWFMNQQQTRAGTTLRSSAARWAAEAGVYQALSILETVAPDGSAGRAWRPKAYSTALRAGALQGWSTLSLIDDADGAVLIASSGEVAGTIRRLRARVYLTSPALLAALYGTSLIRLEDASSSLVIVPYGAGTAGRPWIHIAAGAGIGIAATTGSAINDPTSTVDAAPGPVDAPEGPGTGVRLGSLGPVRILLAQRAELTVGPEHHRVGAEQLRAMGMRIDDVLRTGALPALPEPDRAYLQTLARLNTANADLNAAAGKSAGDKDLALKRDSLYSRGQFERLHLYLQSAFRRPRLDGIIYVTGEVTVSDGQRLTIAEGSLITEGMLRMGRAASLEVTHSASTRRLPGVMVLDGTLLLTYQARLRAHGLVYASRMIDLWQRSHLDVVGAVAANDQALSFRNIAGAAIIRYDAAVLGTLGMRVASGAPAVAWVAAWEELP